MPGNKFKSPKFIFVCGGVISGLGKGITTSSIGLLLKSAGYNVTLIKADMYLNVDAGTMNPIEHGEVFVTADGLESDEDIGHYERFLTANLNRCNYMTMGQVYTEVLRKERALEYQGKCVEGHIHIPEQIIKTINECARDSKAEIVIVEVGGTVGEYQNVMFFESIRRLKQKQPDNVLLIDVVYLPIPKFLGEMKCKPAQASVYELYKLGLQPDFVICRSEEEIDDKRKDRLSFNTGIKKENLIANPDVDSIYRIPLLFKDQELDKKILSQFGLRSKHKDLKEWKELVHRIDTAKKEVKIAITGKYFTSGKFALEDSYVCVIEAIKHAAWKLGVKPVIKWFDVARFEDKTEKAKIEKELLEFDGIIVPQGWGSRGVEGKLKAVQFARENKIPYLGLCFGMQMSVIEFARNILGYKDANSAEVNPKTSHPVIHIMPHQKEYLEKKQYGGTIRLGNWPCKLKSGSLLYKLYKKYSPKFSEQILERHRHRYEVNNEFVEELTKKGLIFSGTSLDGKLMEAVELDKSVHPFFVGTQFHPEYNSKPLQPHPIFLGFIEACKK